MWWVACGQRELSHSPGGGHGAGELETQRLRRVLEPAVVRRGQVQDRRLLQDEDPEGRADLEAQYADAVA